MKNTVIIVAGGKGQRMSSDIPKQFLLVAGKPILMYTIEAFHTYDPSLQIIVVLPADEQSYWQSLCQEFAFTIQHQIVTGGETRFHSVKNALAEVKEASLVAVHDGVRPFVSTATLARCFETAGLEKTAVPVVEVTDTVRFIEGTNSKTIDRSLCKLVQTPQVFDYSLLKEAYRQAYQPAFTDDASVVENLGKKIALVDGNKENIKITTPFDLEIAEVMLKNLCHTT